MPTEGEKLKELISGYLDGHLSDGEQQEVEAALRNDEQARQYHADLVKNRSLLKALSARQPQRLPNDFASRVLAKAKDNAVVRSDSLSSESFDQSPGRRTLLRRRVGFLSGVAAVAAIVLLAINLPTFWDSPVAQNDPVTSPVDGSDGQPVVASNEDDQPVVEESGQAPEVSTDVQYVSEVHARILFAYIIEVSPTRVAYDAGLVDQILLQAGITPVAPIVANADIETALDQSKMIVNDSDANSAIYFIHSEASAIDSALKVILRDEVNFPGVSHNIAMDNPHTRLLSTIAASTGKRFAASESFAAPVVIEQPDGEASLAIVELPKFVSTSKRDELGPETPALLDGSSRLSPVLLVVRIPSN